MILWVKGLAKEIQEMVRRVKEETVVRLESVDK